MLERRDFLAGLTVLTVLRGHNLTNAAAPEITCCAQVSDFATSQVIFSERASMVRPAASIIKLLVAATLVEQEPRLLDGAAAPIPPQAFDVPNNFLRGRHSGELVAFIDLLKLMIEKSDNFAANVLIANLGTGAINRQAKKIGLTATHVHGLFLTSPTPLARPALTTPADCDRLLGFILGAARDTKRSVRGGYRQILNMMLRQSDRRFIPQVVPPHIRVANKTGEIHGEINECAIINPLGKNPILFSAFGYGNFDARERPEAYKRAIKAFRHYLKAVYRNLAYTPR